MAFKATLKRRIEFCRITEGKVRGPEKDVHKMDRKGEGDPGIAEDAQLSHLQVTDGAGEELEVGSVEMC